MYTLPKGIKSVIVINIKDRTDRLAYIEEECAREGIPFELFEAFSVSDPSVVDGVNGCSLSHAWVWAQLQVSGKLPALILEDDVSLKLGFKQKLEALMRTMESKRGWDILWLNNDQLAARAAACSDKVFKPKWGHWGTYSYVVSESFINKAGNCIPTILETPDIVIDK
jgi:GR25 family glycosyltransferase involved in LPS biosynthesis